MPCLTIKQIHTHTYHTCQRGLSFGSTRDITLMNGQIYTSVNCFIPLFINDVNVYLLIYS